jgi:hypothetical protein
MGNGLLHRIKTFIGHFLRLFLSFLPLFFFRDQHFENGVSFTILTKNDQWFLESIVSIYSLADGIVIIDRSDNPEYIRYNKMIVDKLESKVAIKYIFKDLRITQVRRSV